MSVYLVLPPGFYGRFALLHSAWRGLDQVRLHLTLLRHIIFGFAQRILYQNFWYFFLDFPGDKTKDYVPRESQM